ncbi:MAG: DUF998 domain-containing protein [Candidatus Aminicenantes bacterium]|nr:DUF998 domain-containing protein [Candidatus Aminicenantes bacterium]
MMKHKTGATGPELYFFGIRAPYGRMGGRNRSLVQSYMALRRLIGWLGILLPLICVLGGMLFAGLPCQGSISFYYHSNMRDVFIGILGIVSVFLVTYKGEYAIDNIVTWVIGLAGAGVALFPTMGPVGAPVRVGPFLVRAGLADVVHLAAAAVFFLLLALNSIFLFTLSDERGSAPGSNKKKRNVVYVCCGAVILLCLALFIVLPKVMGDGSFKEGSAVLILEGVMLLAFGVSWLVKGETLLKDRKEKAEPAPVQK